MKLNPDCVRAVLLAIEAWPFDQTLNLEKLTKQLPEYSEDELRYTCLKLAEGNYLQLETAQRPQDLRPGIKYICDLTYHGHEYLDTIRDPNVWKKTKGVAKGAGSLALQTLGSIAQEIVKTAALAALSGQ